MVDHQYQHNPCKIAYQKQALGVLMLFIGISLWCFLQFLTLTHWIAVDVNLVGLVVVLVCVGYAIYFLLQGSKEKIDCERWLRAKRVDDKNNKSDPIKSVQYLAGILFLIVIMSLMLWWMRSLLMDLRYLLLALSLYVLILGLLMAILIERYGTYITNKV